MEEQVKITVSYAGIDKRIPLVVTPSLELSDEQVTYAERELHGVIRLDHFHTRPKLQVNWRLSAEFLGNLCTL